MSSTRDADLHGGFERGVLGWNTVGALRELLAADVRLDGMERAAAGAWVWLNGTRFFFASPGAMWPPAGARLVAVTSVGVSVTLHFRKRWRDYRWTGDALRTAPVT